MKLKHNLSTLLRQQNQLLDQQNQLLKQLVGGRKNFEEEMLLPGEKVFVENLFHDEIRDGFLVTAQRKRLWNIQLNLVAELDRICKKHNIRWFAYAGTLLGAARHKGFIPWDDDVDISMLRPDYEKFKEVIKTEIKEPYFVDAWHDYKLEEEEITLPDKSFLQLVKRDQREKHPLWWPFWPMIKLKDSRTTFIQYLNRPHVHQGIWIDVFPFDPVPPFSDEQRKMIYEIERELLFAIVLPAEIRKAMKMDNALLVEKEFLEKFLKLWHRQKVSALESFALEKFSSCEYVGEIREHCILKKEVSYALNNFKEIVYLPFEKMNIPAPVGFEDCLTAKFGNWHKLVVNRSHALAHSADFSYKDFFENIHFI